MIRRNLIANYGGTLVVAAAQVLTIPLYLRNLGEQDWGMLSALLALAATVLVFEAGVSQSVARGIAEGTDPRRLIDRASFALLERRYVLVTAGGAVLLLTLSPLLGRLLLPDDHGRSATLAAIAVSMASAQIVGSLYRGVLIGQGAQVRLNLLLIGMTLVRHASGITAATAGAGLEAVAAVLAASFVLEAALRRLALKPLLTPFDERPFTRPATRTTGVRLLALAGMLGALSTQVDRLFIGSVVGAEALGYYAIAAMLSLAVLQFVYPIANAFMPRLAQFAGPCAAGSAMARSYRFLGVMMVVAWVAAAAFLHWGLEIWLPEGRSIDAAATVRRLFLLHLAGTTINALCIPLHLRLLARHRDRAIVVVNAGSLTCLIVTLQASVAAYQSYAGALAWITFNIALLAGYSYASRTTSA